MRRYCLVALTVAIFALGCSDRSPKTPPKLDLVGDAGGTKVVPDDKGGGLKIDIDPDPGTPKPVEIEAKLPDQEQYDAAVMKAMDFLAEGRRQDALDALEAAQKIKDTGSVQREIDKVRTALAQEAAAVKAVADVKTVLADGKADDAAKLAAQALAQHGGGDQAVQLASLEQQAAAVVTAGTDDIDARIALLRAQADEAEKQQNLRSVAVALEQAIASKPDEALTRRLDEVRGRLETYDANRSRAAEMRKDPARLDEALTRLVAAKTAWNTPQVTQEIDEVTLVLERRRDRLSVADFEVRGDVGVAGIGRTVAEELLGYFKPRYDLVERSQLSKVLDELKLDPSELIDSREGGRSVARLAKVRYLVVGSITPLAGITVQARLIEVSTGLVVQTARVTAPDLESLLPKLKQAAILLQMNDEQKAAYEDRIQAAVTVSVKPIVATPLVDLPPPPPVTLQTVAPPPPILTFTPARPALGGLVIEDFRALPAVVVYAAPPPPPPALALQLTRDDPRRNRLFRLSLELGDNLFRRRQYAEANRHFGLALSLGGPRRELAVRIDTCRQYLPPSPPPTVVYTPVVPVIGLPIERPPVVLVPPPSLRPRVAVFGFNIYAPATLVPPSSSEVLADQFASYCGGSYNVIDRGEVCWYMGRLGLTMRELLNDPVSRRCLAQSLNARYLIFGTVTPTASFNVETHLFDATSGDRTATGKIHVQDHAEMKLRMGELAQQIGARPADRAALVQQGAATEKAITSARSLTATDPSKAAAVASEALKAQPDNVALQSILAEAQRKQKLASLEAARTREAAANAAAQVAAQKRQAELTKQLDLAKLRAADAARASDAASRKARDQQNGLAAGKLREQAGVASKSGDNVRAAQLLQSAVALAPSKALSDELVLAQRKAVEAKKATDLADQKRRDQAAAVSRESAQARIAKEKAARDQINAERRKTQEAHDKAAHDAYVKQAKEFVAKKDYARALSAAEAAQRLQPGPEGAKLVSDSRHELAVLEAEKKGAGEKAKVEAERKAREVADAKSKIDRENYLAAVKQGQDAVLAKKYDEAIASYTAASKLFRTDVALTGLKTATDLQAGAKKATLDAVRVKELVGQGNVALGKKDYARALGLFQEAKKLAPVNEEVSTGLAQAQRERDAEVTRMRRDADARALVTKQMAAGKNALAKKQFADAATAFRAVLSADATNSEAKKLLSQAEASIPKPRDEDYKLAMSAGLGAYKTGNWLGAINSYTEALRLRPGDDAATAGLSQARVGQKQADYTAWMQKAQAAVGTKKWTDALAAFDKALEAKPGDATATAAKKDAVARSKETTPDPTMVAREAAYKKAITTGLAASKAKRWTEAIAAYDEALKARPGDVTATQARSVAVKERTAELSIPRPNATYQTAMARAAAATKARKWAEAIAAYDEALKANPGDATATQGRLSALAESKKPVPVPVDPKIKAMEEAYRTALTAAQVASTRKQWAEAVKSYDAALQSRPGDQAATAGRAAALTAQRKEAYAVEIQRGLAAMAAKKYADAIVAYDAALKLVPGDAVAIKGKRDATDASTPPPKPKDPPPPPANPLVDYTKAMTLGAQLEAQKKWSDAATAYALAVQSMPGDFTKDAALKSRQVNAYAGIARAEHARNRYAEAIKAYDEVLKRNPADANARAGLARAKANKP